MGCEPSLETATALMATGRWSQARALLEAALAEEESAQSHQQLGACLWWLNDVRLSLAHRERAVALHVAAGATAEAALLALDIGVCYLTNLDDDAVARGWFARAARLAETAGDDVLDGWVCLISGYVAEDPDAQRELLGRALETARARAAVDLELVAMADLGLVLVSGGEVRDGLALLDEAMAGILGGGYQRLETMVWASCSMLAACSLVGDVRRASQWCAAADRFAARFGCPYLQARCRAHYGRVLVETGRWQPAEQQLTEALAMDAGTGSGPRTEALTGLAELRLRQGRLEEAGALVEGLDGTGALVVAAGVHLARGRPEGAVEVLRSAAGPTGGGPELPRVLAALVEAELACGDLPAARRTARELGSLDRPQRAAQLSGLSDLAAAQVAAAAGEEQAAIRRYRAAAARFTRDERLYDAARAQLGLATVLAGAAPVVAAREASAAQSRLHELGAARDADAAAALVRRLGGSVAPGRPGPDLLTSREREVLALLEHGLTNPQIGERLFITRKTVAHHVSSILQKLGLASRAEAAAFAARERLDRRPD